MSDEEPWIDADGDGQGDDYETEELDGGGFAHTTDDGSVAIDDDGDGYIDSLYIDSDGDGTLDTVMTDDDGDGYVDSEAEYDGGDPTASGEAEEPNDDTAATNSGMPLGYLGN